MTKVFDPQRPVQTRDGRPARIICTDWRNAHSDQPLIVALIEDVAGGETINTCLPDGTAAFNGRDLVNMPERLECWVVFLRRGNFGLRVAAAVSPLEAGDLIAERRQLGWTLLAGPIPVTCHAGDGLPAGGAA